MLAKPKIASKYGTLSAKTPFSCGVKPRRELHAFQAKARRKLHASAVPNRDANYTSQTNGAVHSQTDGRSDIPIPWNESRCIAFIAFRTLGYNRL